MPVAQPPKEGIGEITEDLQKTLDRIEYYRRWDSGYMKQQSTRPQTLGYGLVSSPVAQMAWIVEKFWSWMDCDGHPENVLHRDELLDNVMLYWATGSGASSARLYWESANTFGGGEFVSLPTGIASFPLELMGAPRGGHFAAFEQPELFVEDVRTVFDAMR